MRRQLLTVRQVTLSLVAAGLLLAACQAATEEPATGPTTTVKPELETPLPLPLESRESAPEQSEPAGVDETTQPAGEVLERVTLRAEDVTPPGERVEPTATPARRVTGEVPAAMLQAMIDDLAGRLGLAQGAIEVVEAQEVTWPDGSMGCPEPGMVYTMALVEGYRVVLESGGLEYPYHAARSGYYFLCEQSLPGAAPLEATPKY
jgi:hypothetical protein